MCWVMPPASPAATSVSRIASSSEVLPWSTWPMIVTTGGRSARSSSASANCGSSGSSSAAVTISSLRSYSSAIALIDSSVRVWVRVAISPIIISFLITSAGARPERLGDLAHGGAGVDLGRLGLDRRRRTHRRLLQQRPAAAAAAAARRALRRRAAHLVAAGGLRVDHDAAFFGAAAAAAAAALLGAGGTHRFGRSLGFRPRGFRPAPLRQRRGVGAAAARRRGAGAAGFRQRARLGLWPAPRRRRCPWRRRSPSARRLPRRWRPRLSPRPRRPSAPPAAPCVLTPCAFAIS